MKQSHKSTVLIIALVLLTLSTMLVGHEVVPFEETKWEAIVPRSGVSFVDKGGNLVELSDSKDAAGRPFFAAISNQQSYNVLISANFNVYDSAGEVFISPAWKDTNNWVGAENDRTGIWEVTASELVSGSQANTNFKVK